MARYSEIVDTSLLEFINVCHPHGHRLQEDNDPKHISKFIGKYFAEKSINWLMTPADFPDLNPVWGSLMIMLLLIQSEKEPRIY